jgi:DHA1 family bicyclomycin/chloramphenicol resistance-like MFS transporter
VSTIVLLASAIAIVVLDLAGAGFLGTVIPLWFFITACGFGFPMVQALALVNHGKEAGTAASLLGAMNFGLAGLISPIVGLFGIANAVPMATVMAVTAMVSIASLWLIVRPRTVPALSR